MMIQSSFNYKLADAQAIKVAPVAPEDFPFQDYQLYAEALRARARAFWAAKTGVLVYRRMRVAEVFSAGCREMDASLRWQLGALAASMDYPADLPNFLEPWYGIGTTASAYGSEYIWNDGQAPAMRPRFGSAAEALSVAPTPVAETAIGRHTLAMIEYFLERTGGRLPLSLCDIQSPLNVACNLVDVNRLMLECLTDPESVTGLLDRLAGLIVEFARRQLALVGDLAVWPGHSFASSPEFCGLGLSDDNILMVSPETYGHLAVPAFVRAGEPFGGPVFHCCGNWADWAGVVRAIPGLKMVDAAFGAQTDPNPNQPEPIAEAFAGTGIVLNARIVGGVEEIAEKVRRLWRPGLKLIVVTYCPTAEEQAEAYGRIHEICNTRARNS